MERYLPLLKPTVCFANLKLYYFQRRRMWLAFFVLHLVFLSVVQVNGNRVEKGHSKLVPSFNDRISDIGLIANVSARSKLECPALCLGAYACVSFFYLKKEKMCHLHRFLLEDAGFKTWSHEGSKYYSINKPMLCPSELGYVYDSTLTMCYRIEKSNKKDGYGAAETCKSEGGHLIVVENMAIQSLLTGLITCSDFSSTNSYFVDGSDEVTDGVWKTHNGQNLQWFNWGSGQPNNWQGPENCLELWTACGEWNDRPCSGWLGGFICQIDI